MTESIMKEQPTKLEQEASRWLMLLDCDESSEADYLKFQAWLETDEQHRQAYEDVASWWGELGVLAKTNREGMEMQPSSEERVVPSVNWAKRLTAIAAVFMLAVLGAGLLTDGFAFWLGVKTYETAMGEHEKVVLADGSTVILNTDSKVAVSYSGHRRIVELSRGEAYFDVVPDPDRPFFVNAGKGAVQVLGTAFSVYVKQPGQVEVIVAEGKVAISPEKAGGLASAAFWKEGKAKPLAMVSAGQKVEYGTIVSSVVPVPDTVIRQQQAWQNGMLLYEGKRLADVLTELKRYSKANITILDEGIADIRVGGYFKAGDVQGILASLEYNFGIKVEQTGGMLFALSRAEQQ